MEYLTVNERGISFFARWAAVFTLAQIAIALALAPGRSGQIPAPLSAFPESAFETRYRQLNNWDSQHYRDIALRGYQMPVPISQVSSDDVHSDRANLGFFPAYPMIARALGLLTGVAPEFTLLWVSQIGCFLFWLYFFLLLARWGVRSEGLKRWGLVALAYPTSFYLVLGYSESLFMAALLGMVFWSEAAMQSRSRSSVFWLFAGAHGLVLSATRLVGIPLVFYPLGRAFLEWFSTRPREKCASRIVASAFASVLGMSGACAFFLYCHSVFGKWNLYILLQQKGWQNLPDYLALFKPWTYLPRLFFEDTIDSISRASVPVSLGLIGVTISKDQTDPLMWKRASLYGVAFLSLYISLSGKANANMDSMIRYTLPAYVILVLTWAWKAADAQKRLGTWARFALGASFALQGYLAFLFLRGHWVA